MKVRDLITELSKLDQNSEVVFEHSDFEFGKMYLHAAPEYQVTTMTLSVREGHTNPTDSEVSPTLETEFAVVRLETAL